MRTCAVTRGSSRPVPSSTRHSSSAAARPIAAPNARTGVASHLPAPAAPARLRPRRARLRAVLPIALLGWLSLLAAGAGAEAGQEVVLVDLAEAEAIVAAPDRTEEDRKRDVGRHPAALLAFAKIGPGMRVAEIGAGSGYTTELLARAVAPGGSVYAHNTPYTVQKYVSETWPARLERPVNANVIRVDAGFDDPLPRSVKDLDAIFLVYVYHDWYLSMLGNFDQRIVLRRLYKSLKPGGRIIVVDHRATPGARGDEVADELHRIDEDRLVKDFESAGFELEATADFMANPDDPRTEPFFAMDGPTDTFVHRWVRPTK